MKVSRWILVCLVWAVGFSVNAGEHLDDLVARLRREVQQDRRYDEAREQRFIEERNKQHEKLKRLRADLGRAEKQSGALRSRYEENEARLAKLDEQAASEAGELNDLFAMVQQNAAEIGALLDRSMVSAQNPQRGAFLNDLAQRERAISMETLREMWLLLVEEMNESGKVARFTAPVITAEGEERTETVTRAGVFSAVSDGRFLRYLPESRKLVELARQPALRYRDMARELEEAEDGWRPMAVDPSKGAILALLVQSPDFLERLRQSGAIGYVILALGAVGLLIVLWRGLVLALTWMDIRRQSAAESNFGNTPLGRLETSAASTGTRSSEALAARLDDLVHQESSRLFFGLTTLTVFAAVTPLLGLLGTVIGMIETFQSISLFGTGDPKLMAGGISYALVTTQLGLAVAIPLLLLHSFLHGQANRIVDVLDQEAARLFERYDGSFPKTEDG